MKKLRRSRFAKFTAGLLVILMSVLLTVNIAGTLFLLEENLFYASREQLCQKIYSNLYNYTAGDLMLYLSLMENSYCNNDNYKNYHLSEIELYHSKYSSENSNVQFNISDENNRLLLSNNNPISGNYFSFSSVYSTDIEYDEWYKMGNSDIEVIVTDITKHNDNYEETTFFAIEEGITPHTDELSTSSDSDNKNTITSSSDGFTYKTYSVSNVYSNNSTELTYYYQGEINENILEANKEIIRNLPYDITEITLYQDEYIATEDGFAKQYSYIDDSRELRTIRTKLISDTKSAEIEYSYNGTLSFSEFSNRLSYSALILHNSGSDSLTLRYLQTSRLKLSVNINIPYECHASDIYNAASVIIDGLIIYKNNIIPITISALLMFIFAFIFLFYSAGYIPDRNEPVARGLHHIPTDIALFILLIIFVCSAALISTSDSLFIFVAFCLFTVNLFLALYSIIVKIRTRTFYRNTVIYRFYRLVKSLSETLNENTGTKVKIIFILLAFLFISLFEAFAYLFLDLPTEYNALFFIFLRITEIPFIAVFIIGLVALQKGGKQISAGDINYRIKSAFLFGPLKKHAEYLNSINSAVTRAVEERMKSENLKTELITNVSHDLKTPLTSIVNYIDLLKKEKLDNVKANEYIEVIDRQSQRLKKLTIDIVEASKAATGNIDINYENTVLNVILLQTNGEYAERLQENNLTLIQEIPENEINISTDGRLLWRIIDNLMNNICKYSMPGTRVYINLFSANNNAIITFRNISKNKLTVSSETLTERFVRGDTARNSEGSGLGLSIAKSLTENMGGKLDIFIDGDLFKVTLSFPM